ncbi:MAG: hypothetical protein IJW40_04620 [Clostridia bacterium]|nr:hypothetical protein [Clostridia bacterium]
MLSFTVSDPCCFCPKEIGSNYAACPFMHQLGMIGSYLSLGWIIQL